MQDVTNNKDILSDTERKWFYALSRFPTEIIEGKLFIVLIGLCFFLFHREALLTQITRAR
jgi:hypothetical protein